MSQLIGQLMTTELKVVAVLCVLVLIVLYVLSIVWVVRDAYLRGAKWKFWGLISIIPVAGIIAYCLMRPPLMQIDKDEQELEIAIKRRELRKYGECGACGYPVEDDYLLCPHCLQRLKNMCPICHRACDPSWTVCPYCASPIPDGGVNVSSVSPRRVPSSPSAESRLAGDEVMVPRGNSERRRRPTARGHSRTQS